MQSDLDSVHTQVSRKESIKERAKQLELEVDSATPGIESGSSKLSTLDSEPCEAVNCKVN